jgi:hypothetical protein
MQSTTPLPKCSFAVFNTGWREPARLSVAFDIGDSAPPE